MYNPKNETGFLYYRLKNQGQRNKVAALANNNDDEMQNQEIVQPHLLTQDEEAKYKILFKTCIVPQYLQLIQDALRATIGLRDEMLKVGEFQENFPFFFGYPPLVQMLSI